MCVNIYHNVKKIIYVVIVDDDQMNLERWVL